MGRGNYNLRRKLLRLGQVDKVITQLDAVLKGVEDHRDEDIAGAHQLRRREDQLRKHETRIAKLEAVEA